MSINIAIAPAFNPVTDYETGTARNTAAIINALFGALQGHGDLGLEAAAGAFAAACEDVGIPLRVESPIWGECREDSATLPAPPLPSVDINWHGPVQEAEPDPRSIHRMPGFSPGVWRRADAGLNSLLSRANANFTIYKKGPRVMGVCPREGTEYGDYDIDYTFGIGDELKDGLFTTRYSQWSGRLAKLTGKFRVHVTSGNAPSFEVIVGSLRLWVAGTDGSVTAFRIPTAEDRWGDEIHAPEFAGRIQQLRKIIANECVAMM